MSHGAVGRHEEVQIASATPFVTTMPSSFSRACALSSDSRPAKRENHAESFFPLPIEHTSDQALMIEATEARLTPQRHRNERHRNERHRNEATAGGGRERPAVRRVCPVRDGMKMVGGVSSCDRGSRTVVASAIAVIARHGPVCVVRSRVEDPKPPVTTDLSKTFPRPFRPDHRS